MSNKNKNKGNNNNAAKANTQQEQAPKTAPQAVVFSFKADNTTPGDKGAHLRLNQEGFFSIGKKLVNTPEGQLALYRLFIKNTEVAPMDKAIDGFSTLSWTRSGPTQPHTVIVEASTVTVSEGLTLQSIYQNTGRLKGNEWSDQWPLSTWLQHRLVIGMESLIRRGANVESVTTAEAIEKMLVNMVNFGELSGQMLVEGENKVSRLFDNVSFPFPVTQMFQAEELIYEFEGEGIEDFHKNYLNHFFDGVEAGDSIRFVGHDGEISIVFTDSTPPILQKVWAKDLLTPIYEEDDELTKNYKENVVNRFWMQILDAAKEDVSNGEPTYKDVMRRIVDFYVLSTLGLGVMTKEELASKELISENKVYFKSKGNPKPDFFRTLSFLTGKFTVDPEGPDTFSFQDVAYKGYVLEDSFYTENMQSALTTVSQVTTYTKIAMDLPAFNILEKHEYQNGKVVKTFKTPAVYRLDDERKNVIIETHSRVGNKQLFKLEIGKLMAEVKEGKSLSGFFCLRAAGTKSMERRLSDPAYKAFYATWAKNLAYTILNELGIKEAESKGFDTVPEKAVTLTKGAKAQRRNVNEYKEFTFN